MSTERHFHHDEGSIPVAHEKPRDREGAGAVTDDDAEQPMLHDADMARTERALDRDAARAIALAMDMVRETDGEPIMLAQLVEETLEDHGSIRGPGAAWFRAIAAVAVRAAFMRVVDPPATAAERAQHAEELRRYCDERFPHGDTTE